jgi:hypothetical protein
MEDVFNLISRYKIINKHIIEIEYEIDSIEDENKSLSEWSSYYLKNEKMLEELYTIRAQIILQKNEILSEIRSIKRRRLKSIERECIDFELLFETVHL